MLLLSGSFSALAGQEAPVFSFPAKSQSHSYNNQKNSYSNKLISLLLHFSHPFLFLKVRRTNNKHNAPPYDMAPMKDNHHQNINLSHPFLPTALALHFLTLFLKAPSMAFSTSSRSSSSKMRSLCSIQRRMSSFTLSDIALARLSSRKK